MNECYWDSRACTYAAKYGHLDALKYLHENGCAWDESAFKQAVANDRIEILKYLHDNECSHDVSSCGYCKKELRGL